MSSKPFYHYPSRKRLRLSSHDYSEAGFYFVTNNCKNMECRFGHIYKGKMVLSEMGEIAYYEWLNLISRFANIELHQFQIMPNHMHAIIEILALDKAPNKNQSEVKRITLSDIMCAYKSIVANKCLELHKLKYINAKYTPLLGKIWHLSFNDHIIRDKPSFKAIERYIRNNPRKWNRS